MFSNSSNPFPSSVHGFPASSSIFSGEEKDGVYFSQNPFVSEDCSFNHATPPPPPIKQSESSDNHLKLSDSLISPSRKRVVAASKKDRHSKIFTAKGPRDRRVRLSIDISKKFFGLQDLLGFDKASKTLDWLFTKSKTAIKELVEEMKHTSSSTLSNQCEEVFMEKGNHIDKKGKKKKLQLVAKSSSVNINGLKRKKKIAQKQKSGFQVNLVVRSQLRAEARARARERTIEKSRFGKLNSDGKNVPGDRSYFYLQSTCGNQVHSQSNHGVKIGESFAEQKLPKPYSLLYNSRHNYVDSKGSSSKIYRRT